MIEGQKNFLDSLIVSAPQDVSRPVLEDLLSRGYTDTKWVVSPGAVDAPCISRGGDTMPLAEFAVPPGYDACFYSRTHVGCKCTVTVSGPGFPDLSVSAFGIVEGELPVEAPVEVLEEEPKEEGEPEEEKTIPEAPEEASPEKPEEPGGGRKGPAGFPGRGQNGHG